MPFLVGILGLLPFLVLGALLDTSFPMCQEPDQGWNPGKAIGNNNNHLPKKRRKRHRLLTRDLGKKMIFRNASLVIVGHGLKMIDLAQTNCTLAVRNMELLASTMGLGTSSVGSLTIAARKSGKINKFLKLPKDRTVYASMMLDYPRDRIKKVPAHKPRDVGWI